MAVLSRAVAVCLAACVGPALGANQRTLDARRAQGECAAATSGDTFVEGLITGPLPSTETTQAEASITAADNIEIRYGSNFKVLLERRAQTMYVLTQCGTTPPTQAQIDAVQIKPSGFTQKSFTVPLQAVASETTINLAFFEALGLTDRVRYVTSDAVSACFQKANGCGAVTGNKTEQLPQVDAWFMDCGYGGPPTWAPDCSNINQEAKAVHVSTSQDPGPLHSAEHIKFVAAFFNKEAEATRLFSQTVTAYTSLRSSYTSQPVVAWIGDAFGSGFSLSQATYKVQYVTHAGGVNVDGDAVMNAIGGGKMTKSTTASGSTYTLPLSAFTGTDAEKKSQASQAFFQALRSQNVSAVIDEVYANPRFGGPLAYTMANFTAAYGLDASSDLQFMVDQMVLRIDGTVSENQDLAWYESRVVHPEWASAGLARQLHSDTSKQQMYFRNIAKGESPTMIMKSECSAVAACNANAYPQIIPLMDGSSPAVSAAATARAAFAALLLSLALAMRG